MPADQTPIHLRAAARPEFLDVLHTGLAELWERHPEMSERDRSAFATALAEVVANVIEHAAGPTTQIAVELDVGDRGPRAVVADDGRPFVGDLPDGSWPDDAELTESGRGLALAASLATLTYDRARDRNRWCVTRREPSSD